MSFDDVLFCLAVIVSVTIGLCLGLGINDTPGWYTWAMSWQTLISGTFAVAAALITVIHLQRSHRHVVAINLRADLQKALRASSRASYLQEFFYDQSPASQPLPDDEGDLTTLRNWNVDFTWLVDDWTGQLEEFLTTDQYLIDAEPLFGLELADHYNVLREMVIVVKDGLEEISASSEDAPLDLVLQHRAILQNSVLDITLRVQKFVSELRTFPGEFR